MRRALASVDVEARILESCRSTNDEALAWAKDGAPHLSVVVANAQEAGRGRHGRSWIAPSGEALLCSIVVRPELPVARWGLLPLIAGVAVVDAVRARTGVEAGLKWPNDVLVAGRKLSGILVEAEPPALAVIGIGLNASTTQFPDDLVATSLALEGALRLDRADLLAEIVTALRVTLADSSRTMARYRERSVTLGQRVQVLQGTSTMTGVAVHIEEDGALVLDTEHGPQRVHAGEVTHLRPASS